jgi:two-component system cell cycle sensor histidine kinase/response regulator CckA
VGPDVRPWAVFLVAGAALLASAVATEPLQIRALQAAAAVTGFAGLLLLAWQIAARRRRHVLLAAAQLLIEQDRAVAFVTTGDGDIEARNAAARERFRDPFVDTLGYVLTDIFANPGAVLFRLQNRAQATGHAVEDIVTRRGPVRLTAQRVGSDVCIWRLDEVGGRQGPARAAEGLSLPMLTAGPSGTILYMNEAFRRLVGGRAKSLEAVFQDLPVVSGGWHRVQGRDGLVETLVAEVTGAGGRREIYLLPADPAGQARASGWQAIEDLPVPLLKVAASGEVLEANRQARSLLQVDMAAPLRLSDVLDGLGRPVGHWLRDAAEAEAPVAPEFLKVTSRPEETVVQVALNRSEDGSGAHMIAVLKDVTDFKSLEMQFVQSQKMQAVGQLAGGVAHDFNNLLTAISGHCDLLLLRRDQGDPDYGDLMQIHQNANRAAGLVGQLLAFSRKQTLRPEPLDLRDTLADLTHLLNRLVGERIRLTLTHDPGLKPIRADRRQLEQVLMNLVVNARDAMPGGGVIRIATRTERLATPLRRDRALVPPGEWVTVQVIDEGSGIAPEVLTKIFEPFYTTKRTGEGTGLGLSTAYGIVKQTGGFIFADSTPGEGTIFTLYFPAQCPTQDRPAVPEQAVQRPDRADDEVADGVVLLVEDEAPVRAFASRALRLRGYTVLEADSGEAALDMLAGPGLAVDVFVTDVVMPGKDGPTWVREALSERPDTRVVFVSGYSEDAVAENHSQIPNSLFLAKPFSLTQLTDVVARQMPPPRLH